MLCVFSSLRGLLMVFARVVGALGIDILAAYGCVVRLRGCVVYLWFVILVCDLMVLGFISSQYVFGIRCVVEFMVLLGGVLHLCWFWWLRVVFFWF